MPYAVRGSLGLLLWMSWWWISEPVNLAVTGFLPLVVLALFNFLPVARILPSYSEELIILLLGANILSTTWTRWGLDRRIALVSLIGVGTGALLGFGLALLGSYLVAKARRTEFARVVRNLIAALSTASKIFRYPVHRHRLPLSASLISSRVGAGFASSSARAASRKPGVQ